MNAKLLAGLTVAVSAIAASTLSAPAQAFSFGTDGIKFDTDTQVNFSFVESHGAYTSALSIFETANRSNPVAALFSEVKQSDNGGADEWKGTFGNAVASSTGTNLVSFLFKAGVDYTLALNSGGSGTVFSTSNLNSGSQQAVFGAPVLDGGSTKSLANPENFASGNPFAAGGSLISFDDRGGGNDRDFQDFTVRAEAVPEPLTMAGLALAGAGMTFARRRQRQERQA